MTAKEAREKCFECDNDAEQAHHVIPKMYGGTKTIPLCHQCHTKVHGKNKLNTAYMTKLALAKNYGLHEKYARVFWGFIFDNVGIDVLVKEWKEIDRGGTQFLKQQIKTIYKGICLFEWDDLMTLINPILQLESNKFYTEELVKEVWVEFKEEFPTYGDYWRCSVMERKLRLI